MSLSDKQALQVPGEIKKSVLQSHKWKCPEEMRNYCNSFCERQGHDSSHFQQWKKSDLKKKEVCVTGKPKLQLFPNIHNHRLG